MKKHKPVTPPHTTATDKLKAENEYLKLKVLALETLIGVAESELGVKIKPDEPAAPDNQPPKKQKGQR